MVARSVGCPRLPKRRSRTIRHELMHVIDYQQEATRIVCELQPHSIEHRRASVARITEIW